MKPNFNLLLTILKWIFPVDDESAKKTKKNKDDKNEEKVNESAQGKWQSTSNRIKQNVRIVQ